MSSGASGASGASGSSGASGASGASGSSGASGASSGASGASSGASGSNGSIAGWQHVLTSDELNRLYSASNYTGPNALSRNVIHRVHPTVMKPHHLLDPNRRFRED